MCAREECSFKFSDFHMKWIIKNVSFLHSDCTAKMLHGEISTLLVEI